MFAKLYGADADQILVKLDVSDVGAPEVRVFYEPKGLGVCSVAVGFPDSEKGWDVAEAAFNSMDEPKARAGVAAAMRELNIVMTDGGTASI